MVLELLESFIQVCMDYFGDISETILQDNIVIAYQVTSKYKLHLTGPYPGEF
jgi:hypothetical protein